MPERPLSTVFAVNQIWENSIKDMLHNLQNIGIPAYDGVNVFVIILCRMWWDNRKIATTRQNFIWGRCMPSSLLRLTYLTRPRQSIRVSFSRLQNLQMHGLVNTDDETVVLRVWCNPFAMTTRPLSNCFVSFCNIVYQCIARWSKKRTSHNQTLHGIKVFKLRQASGCYPVLQIESCQRD